MIYLIEPTPTMQKGCTLKGCTNLCKIKPLYGIIV